jgi:cytochrome P450
VTTTEFEFVPMGEAVRDPYPIYRRMREAGRVLRTSYGVTLVHRHEDVRRVHHDFDAFSMGAGAGGAMAMSAGSSGTGDSIMARTMLTADPPDHERLRNVVARAFNPRSIVDLEPRISEICHELLAPLAAGEPFDLVADFAAPLPTIVIAELLGIPPEDSLRFRRWTEVVTGTDVRRRVEGADRQAFASELRAYLQQQIERRKAEPTDDLIGRMVVANRDEVMTDDEVLASCVLLLIAGNETTMRLITNMALALHRHPEQMELLAADPGLIPAAVEETLRYDSPVQMLFRGVKKDTEVAGTEIPAGQTVLTMLAAANRDPDVFDDPDRFDLTREHNPHVSLGYGIHFCLGAPLARREARQAFEELFRVAPRFRVLTADADLEYPQMLFLRSPRSLAVQAA